MRCITVYAMNVKTKSKRVRLVYRAEDQTVLNISLSKDLEARIKQKAASKSMPVSVYLRGLAEADLAPQPAISGEVIAKAIMTIARQPGLAQTPSDKTDTAKAIDEIVADAAKKAKKSRA